MKVLVTGLRGTVGRALAARLAGEAEVVGWDRSRVPIDHYDAMDRFVADTAPDVVVNLAIASQPTGRDNEQWHVNHEWPSELAWICRQRGIRFVHTSTVMVFTGQGPFTIDSQPDAEHGYGHHKRAAEGRVRYQNPDAVIVRLGWQIGDAPGSNNMVDWIARTAEHGPVPASTRFVPACSFLADTADALAKLLRAAPGLYMIDGNTEGAILYAIARALAALHGDRWSIVPTDEPARDERMIDPRVSMPPLAARLAR